MPDSAALGYFLELVDEAESILSGDALREAKVPVSYHVEEKKEQPQVSLLRPGSVLFVLPFKAGPDRLLSSEEEALFRAWWDKSLHIREDGWSLTSLIREGGSWERSAADRDKALLRDELLQYKPRALVLFGYDLASYMTRKSAGMDALVKREFSINRIRTFVTWSPSDYLSRPNLKRPIWDNLCYIRDRLG